MDEQLRVWELELTQVHQRIAPHFYRSEPRQRVLSYYSAPESPVLCAGMKGVRACGTLIAHGDQTRVSCGV